MDILIRQDALPQLQLTDDQKDFSHLSSGYSPHNGALSFYCVSSSQQRINVLVKNAKDYTLWVEATEAVRRLIVSNGYVAEHIHNKPYRVKLFQALRGAD